MNISKLFASVAIIATVCGLSLIWAEDYSSFDISAPSMQKDFASSVCTDGFDIKIRTTGEERYNVEKANFVDVLEVELECKSNRGREKRIKTLHVDNILKGSEFEASKIQLTYFPAKHGEKKYTLKLNLSKSLEYRGNPPKLATDYYHVFATSSVEIFLLNEFRTK